MTATTTLLNANLLHYYARSSSADNAVTSEPTYHSRSIGVHHGRTEENSLLLDILDEALRIISLDDLLVDNNVAAAAQQEARQSSTTTTGFNGDDNNQ